MMPSDSSSAGFAETKVVSVTADYAGTCCAAVRPFVPVAVAAKLARRRRSGFA